MKFDDLVHVQHRPKAAVAAERSPIGTVEVVEELRGGNNDRFVGSLFNRRKAAHTVATRRRFLKGTLAAASATAAATAAVLGPAKEVVAVDGPVSSSGGAVGYRILSKCAAAYASHNCTPGCGSTPVCNTTANCCTSDGWYRDEPGNGFILVPGICISGGVVGDGWLWTYQVGGGAGDAPCAHCTTIQYRCHDGAYQTVSGDWVTSICRKEMFCDTSPIVATPAPIPTNAPQPTLAPIPTPVPCSAIGTIESITDNSGGQVTLTGWAKGATSGPINYEVQVDGVSTLIGPANGYRPDIQAAVPGAGTHHGYVANLTGISPGTHEFCVYALENTCRLRLTCLSLTVSEGGSPPSPTAVPTPATTPVPRPTTPPGRPDATPVPPTLTPVPTTAGTPRPTAVPGQPTPVPPQPAPTPVPAPLPPGSLPPLGASTPHRPIGSVDVLQAGRDHGAFASGWAGDADTRLPVYIVASVGGVDVAQTTTSLSRSDVGRAFPHMGAGTGWTLAIPYTTSGTHNVCIYVVDPEDGRRFLLGCRDVTSVATATSSGRGGGRASAPSAGS